MILRRAAVAIALALVALLGAPCLARAEVPLAVDLGGCPDVPRDAVERLVRLELRATVVPDGAQVTRVAARCAPTSAAAELEVRDALTGKSVKRQIDLAAAGPVGRPRLLALAMIELVSASWSELEIAPQLAARAPPAVAAQALASVRQRAPRPRVQLGAMGVVHGFFAGTGPVGGAGARLVLDLPKSVSIPIDLTYERGQPGFDLGSVSVDVLSVAVALTWRREWARAELRLGGGVRGGTARFEGQPRDATTIAASSFWTGWIAPAVVLAAAWRPTRRLALELGLDGGWAFSSMVGRVAGTTAVELTGPFIGASLGVAVAAGG